MRTVLICVLGVAVVSSGCGSERRGDERASPTVVAADATSEVTAPEASAAAVRPATRRLPRRPLSVQERSVLRMVAGSIDKAIGRYDAAVGRCVAARWASCIDGAWRGLVTDLDWPPYYLRRFDTQTRQCEPLANGVRAVYGFNIGARQLDYPDPDVDASMRRSGYLALVDELRPVPSELLDAASSACR